MNATSQQWVKMALRSVGLAAGLVCAVHGQTLINLGTQSRDIDFSNASSTKPVKTGSALPTTCSIGDLFFNTNAQQGQNLYGCPIANIWAVLGAPPVTFYQNVEINGTDLTQRPALNFSNAFSVVDDSTAASTDIDLAKINPNVGTFGSSNKVPVITVDAYGLITGVSTTPINLGPPTWGSITGTLSNQVDLQSALNGKQPVGNYLTALTGDVAASGPGSATSTLATVNNGPGQCGDATHVCQVTTDAKGRVTAQGPVAIAGGTGTVTHTLGALNAGQLVIGNGNSDIAVGDLTGDVATSGSTATTLATVNSGPGQCGDATHVCQVTTDGKGRVTAQAAVSITGTGNPTWGSITGTLSNQTDLQNALNGKQPTGNYLTALTGDVAATGPGSATSTLATVNNGPGQCGDATHVCQVTTDGKGRVTAQAPVAIAGGSGNAIAIQGISVSATAPTDSQVLQYQASSNSYVPATISSGSSNWAAGTLASIPSTCTPGSGVYLYFATDQPAAQQIYTCSAPNTWTQFIGLGGSGGLQIVGGALDINPAVVSQQAASETLGFKTFALGLSLLTANTQPACTSQNRGTFWYLNNGTAKDNVQVCVWNGSLFAWVNLY